MKFVSRIAFTAFVAATLFIPGMGSALAASEVMVVSSIPESGSKTIKVPAGSSVRFRIASNDTTGYTYTVTTLMNTAEATVSKARYVAPADPIPGKGGKTVVAVIPEHSGVTVIKFTNIAPGAPKPGAARSACCSWTEHDRNPVCL